LNFTDELAFYLKNTDKLVDSSGHFIFGAMNIKPTVVKGNEMKALE